MTDAQWATIWAFLMAHPREYVGRPDECRRFLNAVLGVLRSGVHAVTDALGNPLDLALTGGQAADITAAETLLPDASVAAVVADKSYDAYHLIARLIARGIEVVIPSRRNRRIQRDYDRHGYKERHLIECFFGKIKQYRRIFSRFEKTGLLPLCC